MRFDINKVDPNFLLGSKLNVEEYDWIDAQQAPLEIRGLAVHSGEDYSRLPIENLEQYNEGVQQLAWHTAGGRVRFRSNAGKIAVRVLSRLAFMMPHMPLTGSAGVDVYRNGKFAATIRPQRDDGGWFEGMLNAPGEMSAYELNLPLYNGVKTVLVGFARGAEVLPPEPYAIDKPVVYYGSSITQGGCASRPGNSYQGHLTRWLNADQINLGFSGSARGEKEMAQYVAGLDMSALVLDYDHNAPSAEHLRATHAPFFRAVRAAHPELPVIFVTKPDYDRDPVASEERRQVILSTFRAAQEAGDKKVWFVDGRTLFGSEDADACTVDGAHPNDLGFYRMAQAIYPALKEALGV